jgi:hypothetical protein
LFLSSRKYDPGCSFWIRIQDPGPDFLPIPDPGVKKVPDPGSATREKRGVNFVSVSIDHVPVSRLLYENKIYSFVDINDGFSSSRRTLLPSGENTQPFTTCNVLFFSFFVG